MGGRLRQISGLGTAIVSVLLTGALASPAVSPAAKLKTRTASTPLPTAAVGVGTPASATATCPHGTRIVGGGFLASPTLGSSGSWPFVYESRRIGQRKWRASAVQGNIYTGATVTAFAYCRQVPSRIKTRSTAVPLPPATPAAPTTTASARCPGRTKAIAGGFQIPPLTGMASGASQPLASLRLGRTQWTTTARRSGGTAPGVLTTYVYCLSGAAPSVKSTTGSVTFPTASPTTTRNCPRGKKPAAGGFSAPLVFTAPGSLPFVYESRKAGRGWRATAVNLTSGPGPINVLAYCS